MIFTVFDDIGQNRWVVNGPEVPVVDSGWFAISGEFDNTYYYDGVSVVVRPVFSVPDKTTVAADGVELVSWTAVADPTKLTVRGPATTTADITGGSLELTFDLPGEYAVRLSAFPYMIQETVINAT